MLRFVTVLIAAFLAGCAPKERVPGPAANTATTATSTNYKTRHVVIVVVDGPRYSETWGSPDQNMVPHLKNDLLKEGVVNTNFFNDGYTYTNSGHAALTTGVRQPIDNGGYELPKNPSIFQLWLQATGNPESKAWLVTSKDKLEVLADTKASGYKGKFLARTNCGNAGNGTGYRADSVTFRIAKAVISREHPNLLLINFKDPDHYGHAGNWNAYLQGIKDCDAYVWKLWQHIQQDPVFRNQTALILTNDHGRHLDGHRDGFVSHGDNCLGCRHLNFFAAGPDFKQNAIINTLHNQTDVPATVAELLGFKMPAGQGTVMKDLFRE